MSEQSKTAAPFFQLLGRDAQTAARAGILATDHGEVPTPIFMPVGTHGVVKTLTPQELEDNGAQIILGNTYHLYLRPGLEVIEQAGGLHRFNGWRRAMLTDSGGFQVFSLAHMGKISDEKIVFRSHIDGSEHALSPEISIQIQRVLGADIVMAFDECTAFPCDYQTAERALQRTHAWEERSREYFQRTAPLYGHRQFLFGIVQGSVYPDLRARSAEFLTGLDFNGYAVGGLAVGEPKEQMFATLAQTVPLLPVDKPRYLMGVGKPEDILRAIANGIDMFDCVLPTRNARNGTLYTWNGRIILKQAQYRLDFKPPDENCTCYTCRNHSRAYLRHLFLLGDMTGLRLNTIHNVHFFLELVQEARRQILNGRFSQWLAAFLDRYPVEEDHAEVNQIRREDRRRKHLAANDQ